jgi:3-dehydroquinate dehydratase I
MTLICAALSEKDAKSTVDAAAKTDADLVEARVDLMADLSGLPHLSKIRQPLIITCMPRWEGGSYDGSEGQRAKILKGCMEFADYVSVELNTPSHIRDEILQKASDMQVKTIVSHHDFEKTPGKDQIRGIMQKAAGIGDIIKVAFTPKDGKDVLNVLLAQAEAGFEKPVIALSMGELGGITRIAGPFFGGFLTYASPNDGIATAPGQYTVGQVRTIFDIIQNRQKKS